MPHGPRPRPLSMPLDPPRRYRDLIASGDSADRLRSGDLDRRVYGVRAPTHAADELASRCRMFAARLDPGVFFSHLTAARLHEIPLPSRLRDASDLHVTSAAPRRAPHAEHLIVTADASSMAMSWSSKGSV